MARVWNPRNYQILVDRVSGILYTVPPGSHQPVEVRAKSYRDGKPRRWEAACQWEGDAAPPASAFDLRPATAADIEAGLETQEREDAALSTRLRDALYKTAMMKNPRRKKSTGYVRSKIRQNTARRNSGGFDTHQWFLAVNRLLALEAFYLSGSFIEPSEAEGNNLLVDADLYQQGCHDEEGRSTGPVLHAHVTLTQGLRASIQDTDGEWLQGVQPSSVQLSGNPEADARSFVSLVDSVCGLQDPCYCHPSDVID